MAVVCPHCGAEATFERESVSVWEGDVPVGNAVVLTCSECRVLVEVVSTPSDG